MVDVYQLRDADLGALGTAAQRWRQLAEALDKAESNAANNVGWNLRGSHWTGPAADAAYRNLDRLDGDLRHAAQECRLVFTAVDAAHGVFAAQQAKLRKLLDDAAGRFFVTAGGEVTYQEVTFGPGATTQDIEYATRTNAAMRGAAADLHGGIAAIMRIVTDEDAKLATVLPQLDVVSGTDTNLSSWQGVQQDTAAVASLTGVDANAIPHDPKAAAAWWRGPTPEQQETYLALKPAELGRTDGIPADVRDRANRVMLQEEKFRLQTQIDAARLPSERARLQSKLDGLATLESRLDYQLDEASENPYGQRIPPAYLLGYSTDGNGRAIVSVGNPDTAKNVAVYVPGTGATLGESDGLITRAERVQGSATVADETWSTASIMWLGYDAPQDPLTESSRTIYADHGAPKLAQFSAGLAAAHEGPPANTTLIAHSYASLVAGRALERNGMTVDNLVIVGGVGTGPEHATDLHMPADRVWAGTAAADLVPDEAIPVNPLKWFDDSSARFGADPTSAKFGANTLPTDRGDMPSDPLTIPAHSQYWDPGSSSLRAMGRITAGTTS
ncbi:MAG: hypothetical protein HOV66_18820 [Streptomycetaceae bacterium]|nr:hypothetical protein [Streptomycetaceae bacterium]